MIHLNLDPTAFAAEDIIEFGQDYEIVSLGEFRAGGRTLQGRQSARVNGMVTTYALDTHGRVFFLEATQTPGVFTFFSRNTGAPMVSKGHQVYVRFEGVGLVEHTV